MNLIIDQGNSEVKVALFEDGQMATDWVWPKPEKTLLASLFSDYKIDCAILSSVGYFPDDLIDYISSRCRFFLLDHTLPLPIGNNYSTPSALGSDRLAVVVGAFAQRERGASLIIDAGTAITYELLVDGVYQGGNITPGLEMRFKALHTFTYKLPLIKEEENIDLIGISTETAIRNGVVLGIEDEMEGIIARMKSRYPDLFVFLTGGTSFFFEKRLKSAIFVDKYLLLKGLNRILEYNVHK